MTGIDITRMSDALYARVVQVRRDAVSSTVHTAVCSTCGTLAHGAGSSIHAVCNPGHIVTVVAATTTVYEDKGKPFDATG